MSNSGKSQDLASGPMLASAHRLRSMSSRSASASQVLQSVLFTTINQQVSLPHPTSQLRTRVVGQEGVDDNWLREFFRKLEKQERVTWQGTSLPRIRTCTTRMISIDAKESILKQHSPSIEQRTNQHVEVMQPLTLHSHCINTLLLKLCGGQLESSAGVASSIRISQKYSKYKENILRPGINKNRQ